MCLEERFSKLLRDVRRSGTDRLPATVDLAKRLGCSVRAARSLVARARLKGLVMSSRGRGIRLVSRADTSVRRCDQRRWQQVRDSLLSDVTQGLVRPGAYLPSVKELRVRFGCGREAVARALSALCASGVVGRSGRRYRVSFLRRPRTSGAIVHIGRGLDLGVPVSLFERSRECLRMYDTEASERNVQLMPLAVSVQALADMSARRFRTELVTLCGDRPVLGVSVWGVTMSDALVARIVEHLTPEDIPVALFDDTPRAVRYRHGPVGEALFRRVSVSDTEFPGESAAAFLAAKGHRRVGWVTPEPSSAWSVVRLSGLVGGMRSHHGASVVDASAQVLPFGPDHELDRRQAMVNAVGTDAAPAARGQQLLLENALSARRTFVQMREHTRRLRPAFEWLLQSHPDLTVWVCANDSVAVLAHDFLAERGLSVPRDISLIGFDDSADSFYRGLSSYNFNSRGVALALLTHLLDRNRSRELWGRRSDVSIEGVVHDRGSVADVRGHMRR